MTGIWKWLAVVFWGLGLLAGCGAAEEAALEVRLPEPVKVRPTATLLPTATAAAPVTVTPPPAATAAAAARLIPEVVAIYPHDTGAFTQGLLWHDGRLYESTGIGSTFSSLRQVELESGAVLRQVDIDPQFFGEGLTLIDGRLLQLTWLSGVAFIYDLESFERLGQVAYEGQGWGICYDGRYLWMTDGGTSLQQRDPLSFELLQRVPVTLNGEPLGRLNELECVGDLVYANIWKTDDIVAIDKGSGEVTAVVDARGLLSPEQRAGLGSEQVLNGIAYDPEADLFYLTGKEWPWLFAVRLIDN